MINAFVKVDTIEILPDNVLNMIDHGNFMINVIKHIGILEVKVWNVLQIVNVFDVYLVIVMIIRIAVSFFEIHFLKKVLDYF